MKKFIQSAVAGGGVGFAGAGGLVLFTNIPVSIAVANMLAIAGAALYSMYICL